MPIVPSSGSGPRTGWLVPGLAIVVTAALAGLGLWQLERAAEKGERTERMRERAYKTARPLAELTGIEDPAHFPVADTGRFDHDRAILLDNRIRDGRAGYHLLVPFQSRSGEWALVNRGWLPRGRDRQTLPDIPRLDGEQSIRGHAHVRAGEPLVLREDRLAEQDWPLRVQRLDRQALEQRLGVELAPFVVRLTPEAASQAQAPLPPPRPRGRTGAQRHYAYAVQWFALAGLAPWLFLWASRRRNKREQHT